MKRAHRTGTYRKLNCKQFFILSNFFCLFAYLIYSYILWLMVLLLLAYKTLKILLSCVSIAVVIAQTSPLGEQVYLFLFDSILRIKGLKTVKQNDFLFFVCTVAEILLHNRPVKSAIPPIQTVTSAQCQITSLPTNLHLSLSITGLGLRGSDEGPAWQAGQVGAAFLVPAVCSC